MGRRVITKKDIPQLKEEADPARTLGPLALPPSINDVDEYTDKIIKYIPAEIVAAFVAIDAIINSTPDLISISVYWIIFFALLVITPLYIWRVTTDPRLPSSKSQILISTISFFLWVFTLGGPFRYLDWYLPIYGALILPFFTLLIPIVVGK